jgi:hypothetical protein
MEKPVHPALKRPAQRGPIKKHPLADPTGQPVLMLKADASAIQALMHGNADEAQQKRALHWIVHEVCGTYDWPFRPGSDGDRQTDVALGRQFAGQRIVVAMRVNISQMPQEEVNADQHDPTL